MTPESLHKYLLGVQVPKQYIEEKKKPKYFIIVGDQYTGSDYISQVVNQRDDTFMLFEPLGIQGQSCDKDINAKIHTVQKLGRCHFPDMKLMFEDK